ncbi:hypothetical protein [Hyalangium gracile]|uniref:hypothetical protein n=1 Tax=Hyalangium gracile TaxID=394092 RepID=UPI001CCAAE37|nr:hypothetical protein [Hyalangium gracile]
MRRQGLALCLMLTLVGCKGEDGGTPDAGTTNPDPNENSNFTRLTLESSATDQLPLSLAVGPNDVVGVAYFFRVAEKQYEIRYIQVDNGQVSQPERVATVQLVYGLSLAFDSAGKPAIAYLGGQSDDSVFWLQSDAAVAFRSGPNQWTESVAVRTGDQAPAGNMVSDRGFLVGLNPALVFNGTQAFVAYRDGHDGQFPQQDWAGSDLEIAVGGPAGWTPRVVAAGGNDKQAYGGHISMVMANGQPALVHDQVFGSAEGTGSNVLFQRRNADGSWTPPFKVQGVSNTQQGASLAWDATLGYGIAVLERSTSRLTFTECKGNTASRCTVAADWLAPDPVYEAGSGGWYPSLAIDPKTHDPSIAFYICSNSPGVNEGSCNANDDELRVTTRIEGNWREQLVDAGGGVFPKMGYLSSGQRVIAYRVPNTGVLKLAVER